MTEQHPAATSVAVLGTGIMGSGMARNLARAGLDVRAWNRTRAKAEPLIPAGVRVTDTPAEAVAGADVVLTILHDGPAALETMRQAAPALRPGTVWAQATTAGLHGLASLPAFARGPGLMPLDSPRPRPAPRPGVAPGRLRGPRRASLARRVRPRAGPDPPRLARPRHQGAGRERTARGPRRRPAPRPHRRTAGLRRDRQPYGGGP